ncbi:MAG: aminoglycoside phosphotransferase family protein [Caldilineaceae bacterium]
MKTMIAPTPTNDTTFGPQPLETALNPRRIQPVLRSFLNGQLANGASGKAGAACHILDAKYEPGKSCSILYEVGAQMVIGQLSWPSQARDDAEHTPRLPTMQLYPFEQDPDMAALPTVMDGEAMRHIFNASLPTCAEGVERVVRCRATLLRYRLGKRGTLRYDLRLRNAETGALTKRTLFGKLYHSADKAEAVYHEMQLLTEANQGKTLVMAGAAAFIPALPMVLQAPVSDTAPLELLLLQPPSAHPAQLARVTEGIRRSAAALADLHQSTMQTSRIRSVDAELDKLARRCRRAAAADANTGAALYELAQALPASRAKLTVWGEEITVVHGDCKPSQFFLLPADKMALLDFDHCGMADPASDVGNFLATLRQMGIKQILKQRDPALVAAWQQWLATLEKAFLDAYVASRGCPANFRQRAAWYQAQALLRKALRSFARSTRSPLPGLLVQEAWCVLELL